MLSWTQKILIPYVRRERKRLFDENAPALLIFDGLKSHFMEDITRELTSNNIKTLCIPPHSSHILQVMDLSIFGPMKTYYRNSVAQLFSSSDRKMAKKVEKILKSFYQATYKSNIFSGWNESGIEITFTNGNVDKIEVNRSKVLIKVINK